MNKIICFDLCLIKQHGSLNNISHTKLQVSLDLTHSNNHIKNTNEIELLIQKMLNTEVNLNPNLNSKYNDYNLVSNVTEKIKKIIINFNIENNKKSLMLEDYVNLNFVRLFYDKKNTFEYLECN